MNIPFHVPYIDDSDIDAAVSSIKSGWTTMGPKTIEFEMRFSEYTGIPFAVAVSSCTAALHLALKLCNITQKDEVIVPANTFVATAEVALYCGATPVFADIEKDTHCISVESILKLLSPRTKAIIPVHYAGHPCAMDAIMDIARQHNLYVIEDAAHALPSWYGTKLAGTIGDIGCYSFYATKTLSTGEGGMLVTGNEEWAQRARSLRLHGMNRDAWKRYTKGGSWQYDIHEPGYKYNMTDVAAAMGLTQLQKVERLKDLREAIAHRYNEAFANNDVLIPYIVKEGISAWHLYPLKLNLDALSISRDEFILKLEERGIMTSVHFIPLYRFSYFVSLYGNKEKDFPNAEWVFAREISLPIYPSMTDEQVSYVIENVCTIAKEYKR
ncbi:MAG: DegT/DnrJ/EryC1/StrS family aminotransferase [Spirochaetes bacterium]|nr:DegT/DnrJ/EryC1/StrS family aminotransferase [Spirochaetota bacterium]